MIIYIINLYHTIVPALPIIIGGSIFMVIIAALWDVHFGILRRRNR